MKKQISLLLATVLILTLLTACGGMAGNSAVSDNYAPQEGMSSDLELSDGGELPTDRKLIRTASMTVETEDMTELLREIGEKVNAVGGYVQDRQLRNDGTNRGGSMTVRVPADRLDEFTGSISESGNVTYFSENVDDITLSYVDVQSRIDALAMEYSRLMELMEQAERMEDILQIETKITQVLEDLESAKSRLRVYDNQVDFASVDLELVQVVDYTVVREQTVWERISTGFVQSLRNVGKLLENLFVLLVVALPYLAVMGVIAAAVILIVWLSGRKRARKKKSQQPPEGQA